MPDPGTGHRAVRRSSSHGDLPLTTSDSPIPPMHRRESVEPDPTPAYTADAQSVALREEPAWTTIVRDPLPDRLRSAHQGEQPPAMPGRQYHQWEGDHGEPPVSARAFQPPGRASPGDRLRGGLWRPGPGPGRLRCIQRPG